MCIRDRVRPLQSERSISPELRVFVIRPITPVAEIPPIASNGHAHSCFSRSIIPQLGYAMTEKIRAPDPVARFHPFHPRRSTRHGEKVQPVRVFDFHHGLPRFARLGLPDSSAGGGDDADVIPREAETPSSCPR